MKVRIVEKKPMRVRLLEKRPLIVRLQNVTIVNRVASDPYLGEYVVTPYKEDRVLPTKYKDMTDDVTVKRIPMFEVSNDSGITLVIGE